MKSELTDMTTKIRLKVALYENIGITVAKNIY